MTPSIIFLPGIMGSKLCLGDDVIWPGSIASLKLSYKHMAELRSPKLVATDVLRKFVVSIYDPLIADLEHCGFHEHGDPPTLFLFPYDWRKSNYVAAGRLADLIDKVHAQFKGETAITMIAHSMGGLVSRCYLECGEFEARPGFACVSALITIGTPHKGAPVAAVYAAGGQKNLFLSAAQVKEMADDPNYPSTYELFPPEGEPFAWPHDEGKLLACMNVYDAATAASIGLSAENLAAAKTFHARLNPLKKPKHVRYFMFFGTHMKTAAHISLSEKDGGKLAVDPRPMDRAGDGTVPLWSTMPGVQSLAIGDEHMKLFRDPDFRVNLAILLGVPGTLAAAFEVRVVASERVVETDAPLLVTLYFPVDTTNVDGSLRWMRIPVSDAGDPLPPEPEGAPLPVSYAGPSVERIGVQLIAPSFAGFYRIEFLDNEGNVSAPEEVVVQEPAPKGH